MRKRIREYGITVGEGRPGRLNKISDVPGVLVGHATVDDERHKTGVTVILPCRENVFTNKMTAASYVHNGFGKSLGLVQLEELGTLEMCIRDRVGDSAQGAAGGDPGRTGKRAGPRGFCRLRLRV